MVWVNRDVLHRWLDVTEEQTLADSRLHVWTFMENIYRLEEVPESLDSFEGLISTGLGPGSWTEGRGQH